MEDLSKLSDADLFALRAKLEREVAQYENQQLAIKILKFNGA